MEITFLGQSCFLIETKGTRLLFDPFISGNPLTAGVIDVNTIEADYILLSHAHQDHTLDLFSIAARCNPTVICNAEMNAVCKMKGIEKVHMMNTGGKWTFDWGTVQMVRADHSSSWNLDGQIIYGGNPQGFILTIEGKRIYFSGDTAFFSDMKLFGEPAIDLALLCIGDNFTMGIEDAAKGAVAMKAKRAIGMHYDTFGYIKIDHQQALSTFEAAGIPLDLLQVGEKRAY